MKRLLHKKKGQASIELAGALVLMLIIITGILHVSRMARTSLFLQSVLRGKAGERAMNPFATSSAAEYISNWDAGADGVQYTADDQPIKNSVNLSLTFTALSEHSVNSQDDWQYVVDHTRLPVSMVQLYNSTFFSTAVEMTHERERLYVPVDPVIRELVYGKEDVAIEEEVWMPLMGGLY
ncbi:MAG: pilus assembly protein [Kiritimatiellae bacterium]|nr:pilus assembly protein [Kiritimatiellia bacterium]